MPQIGADGYIPSPRLDLVFKAMFTSKEPESRLALMGFLESVIGRDVKDVSIQQNELIAGSMEEKQPIMDLNCMFNDGEQANVEIQIRNHGNMIPRSEYYLCKLHSSQAVKGEAYEKLHETYQITILDYMLLPPELPFMNEYELRNREGRPLDGSRIRMYYLELTKLKELLKKPSEELTRPEKWALFFKYVDDDGKREKINEIIQKEEGLEMAKRMLEQLAKDTAMQVTLISMEKAENDRINEILFAERKGRQEGIREGRQEGIREGRQEGIREGRQEGLQEGRLKERLDLIRSMAAEGIPYELIAKTTRTTVDDVKKILQ